MLNKILFGGVGLLLLVSPLTTSAATIEELQAQIQQLMTLISQMKGQTAAATSANTSCIALSRNMGPDDTDADTNGEVTKLQQFLAQDSSIYPEARVTGYYGPATTRAVQRWQKANGLVSSGDPDSTGYGYVGPKTRAAMACTGFSATSQGIGTHLPPGQPEIVQAFAASPSYGAPPLAVSFTYTGEVASDIKIQFGDGASHFMTGKVVCDTCTPTFIADHVYTNPGTYTASMSASGPSSQPISKSTMVTVANPPEFTSMTLSATPMLGSAPLSVTLKASGIGASGRYYVSYGDGQEAFICNQDSTGVARCGSEWSGIHTYANPGTYTAKLIKSAAIGAHNGGDSVVGFATITVMGSKPPAPTNKVLTASPLYGSAPLYVSFEAQNLSPSITYAIEFGDGGASDMRVGADGIGRAANTYSKSGTYTVHLIKGHQLICDKDVPPAGTDCTEGVIGTATVVVTSASVQPTITSISPAQGGAGDTITVYGSGFTGKGTPTIDFLKENGVMAASMVYPSVTVVSETKLQFKIDSTFAANVSPGTYEIRYSNSGVVSNPVNFTLLASNTPPSAMQLNVTPTSGQSPLNVTASFSLASPCDSYTIDWGNGSSQTHGGIYGCAPGTSITKTNTFTLATPSQTTYTITVRNNTTGQSAQQSVTVSPAPAPTFTFTTPHFYPPATKGGATNIRWVATPPAGKLLGAYKVSFAYISQDRVWSDGVDAGWVSLGTGQALWNIRTDITAGTYRLKATIIEEGPTGAPVVGEFLSDPFTIADSAAIGVSVNAIPTSISSGGIVKYMLTYPSGTNYATLSISCNIAINTGSSNACGTATNVLSNTDYSFTFYNTSSSSQQVAATYCITTTSGQNTCVNAPMVTVHP